MAEFIAKARLANQREDVTAILAFNGKMFLQSLEGNRDTINLLYDSIVRDDRHHSLTLLCFDEISDRSWCISPLHFASLDDQASSLYLRYSTQSTFNPFVMTAAAAHGLLRDLSRIATSSGRLSH